MVKIDEAFEIRYKKTGEQFQILVDFDKLKEFQKDPEKVSIYDILADQKIFKDQKKGELASENTIKQIFPNLSEQKILEEIALKGECQIPTAYLNKMREEKKEQIINYIAESAMNPVTKTKYTTSMIESAVAKVKYNIDPNQGFEKQAEEILKQLKSQMPISIEKIIIQIEIPGQYCGAFYGPFRKFGTIKKEYYDKHGNLKIHIEITESVQDKVINFIKQNSNNEGSYHVSE